ncbi:energy transducer TonB [Endozoicomonas sp. (ex Bugula neritina AB1)]|nr:energy transducer TonB [Endozoicomonas sp. (ex Bugula neritina AB1)]
MTQSSTVSSSDRLGFTLFMAAAVHAVAILGITFGLQDKPAAPPTLEVTLATYQSKERPKEADYLAQMNQQGSGTLNERAKPSSDQEAEFQSDLIKDVQPKAQEAAQPKQEQNSETKVVTKAKTEQKVVVNQEVKQKTPKVDVQDKHRKRIDLRSEIESLEAVFNEQRQEYARRPRIKRLTAASTMQEAGAFYKESWRRKVEKIGNLNYPEQARRDQLYGELGLMVAINRDGTLAHVEIMHSSGYKVLDDAAIRIVRLASPYAPFGDDLRDYDMVEIIRTWRFERSNRLFSE